MSLYQGLTPVTLISSDYGCMRLGENFIVPAQSIPYFPLDDWQYTVQSNGMIKLEMYLGSSANIGVPSKNTYIKMYQSWMDIGFLPFYDNQQFISIDLRNVPFENNSACRAFCNCQNLTMVTNFNENITNMQDTFYNCRNLVNAPVIPNNVTNMCQTFSYCVNLVNAPVIPDSVINMYSTFCGCYNLIDAPVIPNSVTDMQGTFAECNNLVNAPVIPNSVTDISGIFRMCQNLVNAPEIPNNVTNMGGAFASCFNIIDAPVIPNNVIDMSYAFSRCSNLVNAPEIPNSVTNMSYTFNGCTNLVNAPEIPNSITDMWYTFERCRILTGNIFIYSENINRVSFCFYDTSKTKNVYIPFKYENGEYTLTYNSFSNSYGSGQNGVTLYDINEL